MIEGVLFRKTGSPERESGVLEVSEGALHFAGSATHVSFHFSGISADAGGSNNRLMYFTHPDHPDFTIATSDRVILKSFDSFGDPRLNHALRAIRNKHRGFLHATLTGIGVFVVCMFLLYSFKDVLTGAIANMIPISWEEKAGKAIFATMSGSQVIQDAELKRSLESLLKPLTDVIKESGYHPEFHIMHEEELNAFALPGGVVVIYSSVIQKAESANELFGVLAHELAHVTERHVTRNIVSTLGVYGVFQFLIGDMAGILAALSDLAPYLVNMGFSRDTEREADKIGFEYLLKAHIDPRGMSKFFERVLDVETKANAVLGGVDAGQALSFVNSHPSTKERIETLNQWASELPPQKYLDSQSEFEKFRDTLNRIIAKDLPLPEMEQSPTSEEQTK